MKQPDILCIGEPLIEFVRRKDPFCENKDKGQYYAQGFGGDTSNAIIAAARQDASTGYITALGRDSFAEGLIDLWGNEKVDTKHVTLYEGDPTGIYFVDPVPDGHNYTYFRNNSAAAMMSVDDLPLDYIARAKVLHISGISLAISPSAREMVFAAVRHAKAHGVMVSVDTNLRLKLWSLEDAQAAIHHAMQDAHIALPSYDDAILLTGLTDNDQIIDFYHDLGAEIVALKLGGDGCRLSHNGKRHDIAPFPVKAVDSTAAGDTFAGAFIAQFLKTDNSVQAAKYACAAAAICVTNYGAVNAIPQRKQVEELLVSSASCFFHK